MVYNRVRRFTSRLTMRVAVLAVLAPPMTVISAQRIATTAASPSREAARVTVNVEDELLAVVLHTIAQQAGLVAAYDATLIPARVRVTLHVRQLPADEAFRQTLQGTGLVAHIQAEGNVVIVRGTAETQVAGAIIGKVLDAETKRPMVGVNVNLDTGVHGTVTNEQGTFRLSDVKAGTHTVHVRRVGYKKMARSVTVQDGAVATVDFTLETSTNVLDQMVVTGTVIPTELKAVPNAITVITAKQIDDRGITKIDQLFRGDVPGLFALNLGSSATLDEVTMFSRGATALSTASAGIATTASGQSTNTNPIKTYVDGVELADSRYLSQIDPRSIERIEILTGPQASVIYGSNSLNGVMQIFTKRGRAGRRQVSFNVESGVAQNNLSSSLAPSHTTDARVSGVEGRWSYNGGGSVSYIGSWTPAKTTVRYTMSGGGRMDFGKLQTDVSMRRGLTQNRSDGLKAQIPTLWQEEGLVQPTVGNGRVSPTRSTLDGQTIGLTFQYAPAPWWSHELVVGSDGDEIEMRGLVPGYLSRFDTTVFWAHSNTSRTSTRYSTTARLPLSALAQVTLVAGADYWRTQSLSQTASSQSLTGSLGNSSITRDKPGTNTGGFVQGQLAMWDALFFTYGLRAEWNPNYGKDVQPNIAPRYGVAYTRDVGAMTTKLRASYGRSTRPPLVGAMVAVPNTEPSIAAEFGQFDAQLESPDLGPEFQQGWEGGFDVYFGHRGSLVVTRYNQTVDALIGSVYDADSVRSIIPDPTTNNGVLDANGYGYRWQAQYLNIGSIRNQGWELQGSVTTGPFTTHGTYSWTKSRVIGITPQYRSRFPNNPEFQVGRSFDFLPEHTWGVTTAYSVAATTVSLTINGNGQSYKENDDLRLNLGTSWRDPNNRLRTDLPSTYRALGAGSATGDLMATQRFSRIIEGMFQVQNLANFYRQDVDVQYPTLGRQTRVGVRVRTQ